MKIFNWPWAGVFGGAFFWYTAHDSGFYFSHYNCTHPWVVPAIHIVALIGAVLAGLLSMASNPKPESDPSPHRSFTHIINLAAASLFTLVILWQGIAAFIYQGCAR